MFMRYVFFFLFETNCHQVSITELDKYFICHENIHTLKSNVYGSNKVEFLINELHVLLFLSL